MKNLLIFFSFFIFSLPVEAKHIYLEKVYQDAWCQAHNGTTEVILPDGSRADCITSKYAIEFDFAQKFQESIGQALEYSMQLGKQAGIVLIMEKPHDQIFLNRLIPIANKYNIKVWIMTPSDLKN